MSIGSKDLPEPVYHTEPNPTEPTTYIDNEPLYRLQAIAAATRCRARMTYLALAIIN